MSLAKPLNITMRVLQFLWALLIMALIGNVIAEAFNGNPSVINYTMFVAVFAMLSLFYLIPVSFKEGWAMHPMIPLILDVLNTIFTFCGGVAMAAELGAHSCSNRDYTNNNSLTNGSRDQSKRCREEQATTAFLWFAFAAFAVSTVFSGLGLGGGANLGSRGVRRSGPAMSQA